MRSGMMIPRARYLVAGIAAGLGAALWLDGIAHPSDIATVSSEVSAITQALAVVATAAVAMLATAIGSLVASDWQADVQSRQDWTQLGLAPAHLSLAVDSAPASDVDPRYLAATSDETLRRVFRAHRATAQSDCGVSIGRSCTERASTNPVRQQGRHGGRPLEPDNSSNAKPARISELSRDARVSRSWRGKRAGKWIASRLRFVANGGTWPEWPAIDYPLARRPADIVVLSVAKDDRAEPFIEPSAASAAECVASPACRGPPQVKARRARKSETTAEPETGKPAEASSGDIVVRDNFGPQIPITGAELHVIETYLGHILHDLLAPSDKKPSSGKA